MLWILLLFWFHCTFGLILYNNARFDPIGSELIIDNITAVYSQMNCSCICFTNLMCLTAVYSGINQQCTLYSARLDQGILSLMTTDLMNSVLNFENKTSSLVRLTSLNETVYGIWNTTAGQDSLSSTVGFGVGNYPSGHGPARAFDGSMSTKYVNFGLCNSTYGTNVACGCNTGLYILLQRGSSSLVAFRFRAADSFPLRDPIIITMEGSNQPIGSLTFGYSWTLFYNGSSGLNVDPGRYNYGKMQWFSNATAWYSSYRVIARSKRGTGNFVQYSELELFGY